MRTVRVRDRGGGSRPGREDFSRPVAGKNCTHGQGRCGFRIRFNLYPRRSHYHGGRDEPGREECTQPSRSSRYGITSAYSTAQQAGAVISNARRHVLMTIIPIKENDKIFSVRLNAWATFTITKSNSPTAVGCAGASRLSRRFL